MVWLILISGFLALTVLLLVSSKRDRDRDTLEKIRSSWGQPKRGHFPFDRIERFAEAMMKKPGFHQLSRQTMDDIDFRDLFSFIDRTSSSVGQQYLFHRLMNPVGDAESLRTLNASAEFVASNQSVREKVQKQLRRLNSPAAFSIASLVEEREFRRPKWFKYLSISAIAVPLLLITGLKYPVVLLLLIVPLTFNSLVHFWNREMSHRFTGSFPQLSLLIEVCENLARVDDHFRNEKVQDSIRQLKPFQWKLGFLGSAGDGTIRDEISLAVKYILELIKGFLLLEVYLSLSMIRELSAKRSCIEILFNHVGNIDTAISTASLRAGSGRTCKPEFIPCGKELAITGVYHPLVNACVSNDVRITSKSVLITGSNMSGKSTFLRTVVVNSILAQTISTCFADTFKTPFLRQYSSIRLDDSIEKGTSYFFEEVSLMKTLIEEAESGIQCIFVLDEVFKGTNTGERVAAAKAILSYLNRDNNIVVVSTHDMELSSMLENEYDLYHFEETFADGDLHFDHKLKPGPMKTGNAIKILALSDYPEAIIREATLLARAGAR